jgi:hypothetical protein
MFTKIGHILPKTLQKNGLAPKVAHARVLVNFEEAARRLLPGHQVDAFKILHLIGGTLTVACKSSSVANILKDAEAELRKAVAGTGIEIERLRFMLAPWR